jgi:O-antigen ligase
MLMGIPSKQETGQIDTYTMTSGRTLIWPYVIEKIHEQPLIGYGRLAMTRTGLSGYLLDTYQESFPHPHSAYLEMLLDNGYIGLLLVIPLFGIFLLYSVRLLMDKSDPLFAVVGGLATSLILALLIAAVGSQTFYPREGSVGMWAAFGVMLRLYVARNNSRETGAPLFAEDIAAEKEAAPPESTEEY